MKKMSKNRLFLYQSKETETKIALRLLPRLLSSFIQPRKDTDKQVDLLDGSPLRSPDRFLSMLLRFLLLLFAFPSSPIIIVTISVSSEIIFCNVSMEAEKRSGTETTIFPSTIPKKSPSVISIPSIAVYCESRVSPNH